MANRACHEKQPTNEVAFSVALNKLWERTSLSMPLHARAEKLDERAEHVLGHLPVFSAVCVVFAHGAGEVGFMVGPLSAIYSVYHNGTLSKSLEPPVWCV
eukprot:GHRR01032205.1.p2 GENE.GHRR01032205.1~~GHRR01032205.1.p2  ORF type:complete len:100 (+),score=11.08 GHRR01032205.1:406-705(+)